AYRPDISDTIYSALREAAAAAIRQGHSVVVDAVHARESERRAIEDVAWAGGRPFLGFWLDVPAALLK
uniref:AAA family ATPase n=1 Tax=Klebsiella aerogenes TaxID=548 RepID=UPI00195318B4